MKNMATRESDSAGARSRQLRNIAIESGHVVWRIARPALAADVLIEAAVPVGNDIYRGVPSGAANGALLILPIVML
jgi:hypothetical protein